MGPEALWEAIESRLDAVDLINVNGKVAKVVGLVMESRGPDVQIGDLCEVRFRDRRSTPLQAEVVGFRDERVLLMPLGEIENVGPG
ncbi:MAG TPA: EscN/YscN/HrcN family type III secretion system ATPase, partial [Synergistaceae bacterium]|nr:EscN/YscN/HrcN family type III secretion system ATPase [Synergistaceae bacterium]